MNYKHKTNNSKCHFVWFFLPQNIWGCILLLFAPYPLFLSNLFLCEMCSFPANTRRWPNAGVMLGHRLRRWPNNNPTLGQRLVFAGLCPDWEHRREYIAMSYRIVLCVLMYSYWHLVIVQLKTNWMDGEYDDEHPELKRRPFFHLMFAFQNVMRHFSNEQGKLLVRVWGKAIYMY